MKSLDDDTAEQVMGWTLVQDGEDQQWVLGDRKIGVLRQLWNPSDDMNDAWSLVERIGHSWRGFEFLLWWKNDWVDQTKGKWSAGWVEWSHGEFESRATGEDESPAAAICRAALAVRLIEKGI